MCGVLLIGILASVLHSGENRNAVAAEPQVRAQDDDPDDFSSRRRRRRVMTSEDVTTTYNREQATAWGVEGRIGHLGFKTFGRNDSLSHVELLPYVMIDSHMLFNDSRMFITNSGQLGGNIGLGYRYLSNDLDRVFGGSFWYDIDDTTGELFHQVGLSFETYGEHVDARTNLYLPIADTERTFSRKLINQRFSSTSILYDQYRSIGNAQPGVDVEVGGTLPGEFSRQHRLRVYGGYYHFAGDAPTIDGFRARVEGSFNDYIAAQSELTHDDYFGTNVLLGIELTFSGGSPARRNSQGHSTDKMRRFTQRNYNIIVQKQGQWDHGLVAVDPSTGAPYRVAHVDTASLGANNGSVDDPYTSLAIAQASGADIVYVHAGSVFNAPLTLQANQRLLGEGGSHAFSVVHFGAVAMPNAGNAGPSPTILNAVGDAVTLASNSEFSGFTIDSPTGHGIVSPAGVSNAYVSQVSILNAGGNGIDIQNGTGSLIFSQVSILDAAGDGFLVNGGDASIAFSGSITNSSGRSVNIQNTTGGVVDLGLGTITETAGDGILLASNNGNVIVGSASLTGSSADGISILGGAGNVEFRGTTSVQNAAGTGINVANTAGAIRFANAQVTGAAGQNAVDVDTNTGTVSFGSLTAASNNATALRVANTTQFNVAEGSLTAVNGPAADISGSAIDVQLASVAANGGAVGLNVVNTTGRFLVWGSGTVGSGGLIQNTTTGVNFVNSGTLLLRSVDLDNNDVGVFSSNATRLDMQYARVTNSTNYGVDVLNTKEVSILGSEFLGNGGAGTNTIRMQATTANSYVVQLISNAIGDTSDAAVNIVNSGAGNGSSLTLSVTGNEIATNLMGADAVHLDWDGPLVGNFYGNLIHGAAAANDGFDLTARSATQLSQLTIDANTFDFGGMNTTGIRVQTLGPSSILVGANVIDFNAGAPNGTGMIFDLASSANVDLYGNTITDHVSGGTGILFNTVTGPSTFAINNNLIQLLDPGAGFDRGIIFGAVTNTATLTGFQNNVVTGASQSFFIPGGTSTGQIGINGVWVP